MSIDQSKEAKPVVVVRAFGWGMFVVASLVTAAYDVLFFQMGSSSVSIVCFSISLLLCQVASIVGVVRIAENNPDTVEKGDAKLLGVLGVLGSACYTFVTFSTSHMIWLAPGIWAIATLVIVGLLVSRERSPRVQRGTADRAVMGWLAIVFAIGVTVAVLIATVVQLE